MNPKFEIDGVSFSETPSGLTELKIETSRCTGAMFLHGAHVTAWKPAKTEPVLWTSQKSDYEDGKAIRGGVPICFPWFGPKADDPDAPGHGLARTKAWDLTDVQASDDSIVVTMETSIDSFSLRYVVTMGRQLTLALTVTLDSSAAEPAPFEAALHTYFAVSDVRKILIEGLDAAGYIDKVDGGETKQRTGAPIRFAGEVDRVYLRTIEMCRLVDPGWDRSIEVRKTGSQNTVVWNPWIDKSARMADFGDDEWTEMVCIETANVGRAAVTLPPGQSHTMTASIAVD